MQRFFMAIISSHTLDVITKKCLHLKTRNLPAWENQFSNIKCELSTNQWLMCGDSKTQDFNSKERTSGGRY